MQLKDMIYRKSTGNWWK